MNPSVTGQPTYATGNTRGQVCPVCKTPATYAVEREVRGVMLADYLCHQGHGFMVKWVA